MGRRILLVEGDGMGNELHSFFFILFVRVLDFSLGGALSDGVNKKGQQRGVFFFSQRTW